MTAVFKVGDTDPYISKIQRALNEKLGPVNGTTLPSKAYLATDGGFGPKTRDALMAYQKMAGLPQTGNYDASTAASLDPYIAARFLTDADFAAAAIVLSAEEAMVRAVTEVESKESGFLQNGKPQILFERHQFRKRLLTLMKASTQTTAAVSQYLGINGTAAGFDLNLIDDTLMRLHSDIYSDTPGGYKGGAAEYERLAKACQINDSVAKCSASWGMFQIMGYYFPTLGYKTVDDMIEAMNKAETLHLQGFCKFVKSDPRMYTAFRGLDFLTFAVAYNGPAQKGYDKKIADAYQKFKR